MLDDASPSSRTIARDLLLLALAAAFLFTIGLGERDLWDPNETIYGRAVVEMAEDDEWLVPTVNEKVFAEKPILYYWAARVSALAFGEIDEFTLRIPVVIAGIASVLLVYLLVVPYAGRRRALLAAGILSSMHLVFFSAREVQMDILVLATSLGVIVPLTRLIDFETSAWRAWSLAGVAAGLGFISKGPVTWVVSGLVVILYALLRKRLVIFFRPPVVAGALVAIAVAAPWYLTLWLTGQDAVLYEVLVRQNFERFVDAWDHVEPWWYYLPYLFIHYAPWSWLLPAAILTTARSEGDRRLRMMSWVWILALLIFFSSSESKRAPYLLPVAPAIALLVAGVVERWLDRSWSQRAARIAAASSFWLLALCFILAGGYLWFAGAKIPAELAAPRLFLAVSLPLMGLLLAAGLLTARRNPALAPMTLLGSTLALFLVASAWIEPVADATKSAREFASTLNSRLRSTGGGVAAYKLWQWRAGYSYYAHRAIPNFEDPEAMSSFWRENQAAYVIVEEPNGDEFRRIAPGSVLVHREKVGNRTALLFAKVAVAQAAGTGERQPAASQ